VIGTSRVALHAGVRLAAGDIDGAKTYLAGEAGVAAAQESSSGSEGPSSDRTRSSGENVSLAKWEAFR